jgi:hypothetical protein
VSFPIPRSISTCLVLALASLAGCGGDAVGPHFTPAHVWVLRTINDHRLPYASNDDPTQLSTTLYDTLTLDVSSDTAREIQSVIDSFPDRGPVTLVLGLRGIYTLSSDSIRIRWLAECPPVCALNLRGSISSTTLTLTADANVSPRVFFAFERIR